MKKLNKRVTMRGYQQGVRPTLIYMGFGAVTLGLFLHMVPVEWYIGAVGTMMGFWFQERNKK